METPNRFRSRRGAADYLTGQGLKTSWRTLQKFATVGGGPRYRIFGNRAVYTEPDLDEWIEARMSGPRYRASEMECR